jgi:hypothetical protein
MSPTNVTGRYPALWASLKVGFGWAFLLLICQGISRFWSLSLPDKLSEASVMFLIFLGSYIVLEDLFERLKTLFGISDERPGHEIPASWRAAAIAIIVLFASASHSLLHDILGDLVIHQGFLGTVRTLTYSYVLFGFCILWVWIRGARQQPPRAARYGLACGAILNVAPLVFSIVRMMAEYPQTRHFLSLHPVSPSYHLATLTFLALLVIPGPLFGFVGGWVVDSGRFPRPTVAIVVALAIGNLAYSAFCSAVLRTWLPWHVTYLYPVAAWWLALWLHPETDNLLTVQKSLE